MKAAGVCLALVALVATLYASAHTFTRMRYFCSECAGERVDVQVRPLGFRSLGSIRGEIVSTKLTSLVKAVDPAPCAHRWVFAAGTGGSFA